MLDTFASAYAPVEDRRRSEDGVERKGSVLKVIIISFFSPASFSQFVILPCFFPLCLRSKATFLLRLFLLYAFNLIHFSFIPIAHSHCDIWTASADITTPNWLRNVDLPPFSNNADEEIATIVRLRL